LVVCAIRLFKVGANIECLESICGQGGKI